LRFGETEKFGPCRRERTGPPPVAAGALELHVLADDLEDVGGLAHAIDGLGGDHD
jgi:hypothetical protein